MPDAPFCSIDPWSRSPGEATRFSQVDDDVRQLAAELRRLRHELQAVRGEKVAPEKTGSVRRRPPMATLGRTEGGSHGR